MPTLTPLNFTVGTALADLAGVVWMPEPPEPSVNAVLVRTAVAPDASGSRSGGGGMFLWSDAPATVDGGTVIQSDYDIAIGATDYPTFWNRVIPGGDVPLAWYQITGDQTAGATLVFAEALAAALYLGGRFNRVRIPAGQFAISNLALQSGTYLNNFCVTGPGPDSTELVYIYGPSGENIITISGQQVTLAGLTLYNPVQPSPAPTDSYPQMLSGSGGFVVGSGICATVPPGGSSTIANNRLADLVIRSQPGHGVLLLGQELALIDNVLCEGNGADGFCIFMVQGDPPSGAYYSGTQNVVQRCVSRGNPYRGWTCQGAGSSFYLAGQSLQNLAAGTHAGAAAFPSSGPFNETYPVQEEMVFGTGVGFNPQAQVEKQNLLAGIWLQRADSGYSDAGFRLLTMGDQLHIVLGATLTGSQNPLFLGSSAPHFTAAMLSMIAERLAISGNSSEDAVAAAITMNTGAANLLKNLWFGANVGTKLSPLGPSNYGLISNAELQSFGSAGSASVVAPGSGASPDVPGSGSQQFWSLTEDVTVDAPAASQLGMRLCLIFQVASGATASVGFASGAYDVAPPTSAGTSGQTWICDLIFDGALWRQINFSTWM